MTTPARSTLTTHTLGFPRIGGDRELKFATEKYWQGKISQDQLLETAKTIRRNNWELQKGISLIPSNDFSFYDQILDTIALLGAVPKRYGWKGGKVDLDTYFAMARGIQEKEAKSEKEKVTALEMLKWFDTNYHYLVPEFNADSTFTLASDKIFDEFEEALSLGIKTVPVLIGPLTFIHLGKAKQDFNKVTTLLPRILPVYIELLKKLAALGAEWIQIDEPVLIFDLTEEERLGFKSTYDAFAETLKKTDLKVLLATYFDDLGSNQSLAASLPVDALHVDLTRGEANLDQLLESIKSSTKILSLGLISGRSIWKAKYDKLLPLIAKAVGSLSSSRVWVSSASSLLHSPISLVPEAKLPQELKSVLAFATEKLEEIISLGAHEQNDQLLSKNKGEWDQFLALPQLNLKQVRDRVAGLTEKDFSRSSPYPTRRQVQEEVFKFPLFPTTTIGSLPQTLAARTARLKLRKGEMTQNDYDSFIEEKTKEGIEFQEKLQIDVPVQGEFERNDMVEYFGEKLDGFVFTSNAWVQSFGTRCVKPPIIYADVVRAKSMTVKETLYAQSLTSRPVKGMLTGPITILQWSFVREDIPRSETANQIALAILDEVLDLEKSGIKVIQVDEPAFREGLPIKASRWETYLEWAGKAFRLSVSAVQDATQIHTHMCYCEFSDIISAIAGLDTDVISIESSRSQMKLLGTFALFQYPNEIGPGVFDIHSPRIPSVEEMVQLLREALKVVPVERLWVNPDCGLKTRNWEEVNQQLENMVKAAQILRVEYTK